MSDPREVVWVWPMVVQATRIERKQLVAERLVVDLEADLEAEVLAIGMAIALACTGFVEGAVEKRILLVHISYLEVVACLPEEVAARIQAAVGYSLDLLVRGQGYIGLMAVEQMVVHYREKLL